MSEHERIGKRLRAGEACTYDEAVTYWRVEATQLRADLSRVTAAHDALSRTVGIALCAATLQPTERFADDVDTAHAIVALVLDLRRERDEARLRETVRVDEVGQEVEVLRGEVERVAIERDEAREDARIQTRAHHASHASACAYAAEVERLRFVLGALDATSGEETNRAEGLAAEVERLRAIESAARAHYSSADKR